MVKEYVLDQDEYHKLMSAKKVQYQDVFLHGDESYSDIESVSEDDSEEEREVELNSVEQRKKACRKLGRAKFKICHPRGKNSSPARRCEETDSKKVLMEKYNKFIECGVHRHIQNESLCYPKGTQRHANHVKEEKSVNNAAARCARLIKKPKSPAPRRSPRLSQKPGLGKGAASPRRSPRTQTVKKTLKK